MTAFNIYMFSLLAVNMGKKFFKKFAKDLNKSEIYQFIWASGNIS